MVKCSRCGVDVADSFTICPNCGNSLEQKEAETPAQPNGEAKGSNCGAPVNADAEFCSSCGSRVESSADENRCQSCGSEIPENVLFCPTCGTKVEQKRPPKINRNCPNCGADLDDGTVFCPECGTSVKTGDTKKVVPTNPNQSFADKINLNSIIKPTIVTLIVSIVLSSIGLLIGFSWVSFIIAIILSVGFFAGLVDNEANAIVMGLFVGLILGLLENPLVEFWYGRLAAGLYEWFFGGQILLLMILAIIFAYISNVYLKGHIRSIAGNLASKL